MANTIKESLLSVITQLNEEFEVVVVDGGSSDGSKEILEELESNYNQLRCIFLKADSNRSLGTDRHISVKNAKGDYVILHIDCDDRYTSGITDIAKVYKQIDQQVNFRFGMNASHMTIAPKEYILELGSYRPVDRAEDADLWRRMLADKGLINLECDDIWSSIGYEPSLYDKFKNIYTQRKSEFQLGMSYWSRLLHTFQLRRPLAKSVIDGILSTFAILFTRSRTRNEMPDHMQSYEVYAYASNLHKFTLDEIESRYNIEIDTTELSETSYEIFPNL
jgi:glycosyltransferase involved in cell wall biosynthesis